MSRGVCRGRCPFCRTEGVSIGGQEGKGAERESPVSPRLLEMRKVGQCALKVTACMSVECVHTVVSVCACGMCECEEARGRDGGREGERQRHKRESGHEPSQRIKDEEEGARSLMVFT